MTLTRNQPPTIVIPMVSGIGNAVMTQPMIRQLRLARPEARIVVLALTQPMAEPFKRFEQGDSIETLVVGKGITGLAKLVRQSRALRPDVFVVPFPSNRWQYNALARASGAKRVVIHGYPAKCRAALYNIRADRPDAVWGLHDVEQNMSLLRVLGITPTDDLTPRFNVTHDELRQARQLLKGDDRAFVVMHAGSARTVLAQAKRWPAESYARVIDELVAVDQRRVVLVEGPDEVGVARLIASHVRHSSPEILPLRGGLGVSAAVLKLAKVYVGTDSGLSHLAGAVGTRAVTLFAPADPSRVCPFGQASGVIKPEKSCSPCFMYPWQSTKPAMRCRPPFCITSITPQQVLEHVRSLPW